MVLHANALLAPVFGCLHWQGLGTLPSNQCCGRKSCEGRQAAPVVAGCGGKSSCVSFMFLQLIAAIREVWCLLVCCGFPMVIRQTDRQTASQAGRQTDTDRQTDGQAATQTEGEGERERERKCTARGTR